MKIRDVMSQDFVSVAIDATVEEAARTMAEVDVAALPVVEGDLARGILTERDITVRLVAAGGAPSTTRVAEIMSTDIYACGPDDAAESVARELRDRKVSQAPVLDERGSLVGIVTETALAKAGVASAEITASPRAPVDSASS